MRLKRTREELFELLRGGLIVSCQALAHEPLHSPEIMARMALAAMKGGAVGIRANSAADVRRISQEVDLPIIGLIKAEYTDSEVYITPTMDEVVAVAESGADIIAMDATDRLRPGGISLPELFAQAREAYPDAVFMADCSTLEEGRAAAKMGFDIVGTTLAGYTPYTKGRALPDFDLMRELSMTLDVPVIAEGGIWTPEQLAKAFEQGVLCAVVGTAITRPMEITQRFVSATKRAGGGTR